MDQPNTQQQALLDAIDQLRSLGVGNFVELPQLVICGSPPAERAALLEAITKVPFSQKGNFYSQYTTEVVLRQSPDLSIRISIRPGNTRSDKEREALLGFAPEASSKPEDLPTLIEEAEKYMDASKKGQEDNGYSEDILKVEIKGPLKPNLTLLDPPGLYTSTPKTESEEEQVVSHAMESYMSNPQSIILAVASAKKSQYLQALLESVKQFDPEYKRVLGIIIKVDSLEPSSDEEETRARKMKVGFYARLIDKESINFTLGWHLLCNHPISPKKEKKTIAQEHWSSIPGENFGLENLQRRLGNIVHKHIQDNVLNLKAQIQEKAQSIQQMLARLGPSRSAPWERWAYLQGISSNFQRITNQALAGVYLDDFFAEFEIGAFAGDAYQHSRLRTLIRALNDEFALKITLYGAYRTILETGNDVPSPVLNSSAYSKHQNSLSIRREQLENQVNEAIVKNRDINRPESTNELLIGYLFRTQAMPWQEIAETHLGIVWQSVRYFVSLILEYLTNDETCSALMNTLITPELEKMKNALEEKLGELTSYINGSGGHSLPLPIGRSYLKSIQHACEYHHRGTTAEESGCGKRHPIICVEDLTEGFRSKLQLSANKSEASQIIDEMQAYYDTALVTFIDNIATLAIENCLLRPLGSVLNSQTVSNLSEEQVSNLVSESPEAQLDRECLKQELEKLQAGLQALSKLKIESPPSLFAPPAPTSKPTPGSSLTEPSFFGTKIFTSTNPGIPAQAQQEPAGSLFKHIGTAFNPSFYGGAPLKPTHQQPFGFGCMGPFDPSKYPSTVGCRPAPFLSENMTDASGGIHLSGYQHICFDEGYAQYSPEELRVGDYARGNKPPAKC